MNKVTENTKRIIGQRINELLAINDVKQKELAAHLSIPDNTVSYFVKGARVPNTEQIIKIAQYFNVSADYLLGLTDIKTTDTDLKAIAEYLCVDEELIKKFDIFKILKNRPNDLGEPAPAYDILSYIFNDIVSSTGQFCACCAGLAEALATKALYIKSFPDMHFSKKLSEHNNLLGDASPNDQDIIIDYDDNDKNIKLIQLEMFEATSQWVSKCLDDERINKRIGNDFKYQTDAFLDSYELYQKEHHERSGGNGKHTREKK